MTLDEYSRILMPAGFMVMGAYVTALRGKLATTKQKNALHFIIYALAAIVFVMALVGLVLLWTGLAVADAATDADSPKLSWVGIFSILVALAGSILLFLFTKNNLTGLQHYTTKELDPIVNAFTANADKTNIKLLAGDLSFFGSSPLEIDKNAQYTGLKNEDFHSIHILCLKPSSNGKKVCYGKILTDMPVEFRFYHPENADLNVRGRIKTLNSVTRLLIYNKIRSGVYEALELNTADQHGAFHDHIWNLLWGLAQKATPEELLEYRQAYENYKR